MADGSGTDFSINGSVTIQSNSNPVASGTIRYNDIDDKFEGLLNKTNTFNNSRWAPMSLDAASTISLGGIKVGNNLSITSTGILNASAQSISRKFQKILVVSQQTDTGDYNSITQALNDFFQYDVGSGNFNGEIAGLNKTQYPDPDENNRYTILITPGIYEESGATIELPPYVSLVGDKKEECIVKINASTQFNCRTGSHFANLTLDVSQSTTGISMLSGNSANNVVIENVNFIASTLSGNTTMINSSHVSGLRIEGCNSDILLGSVDNNNLSFLSANGVTCILRNNNISFQSYIGSKNVINATSTSTFEIDNCKFLSEELNTTTTAHTNSLIICDNSSLDIQYSKLVTKGYDLEIGTDTHYNRGISFSSNTPLSTSQQSSVTFLHYEDESQYDKLLIPTIGNVTFISSLVSGSLIKITGSTNSQNNDIFTVTDIFESGTNTIIQLKYDDILVDEVFTSSGTDITIKTLYTISVFASQFICVNETIYFDETSGNTDNYRLQASQCNLNGRDPIVGNNVIVFHYPQEINVGKEDCDFASLRLAMDSINDSSSVKPYIVNVKTGRYQETGTINIPQYVSLKGDTTNSVIVVFEGNNGSYPNNMAISVDNNVVVQNIRMEIPGLLDGGSVVTELVGIGSVNQVGITIGNTVSEDTAVSLSGVEINNVEIDITSSVVLANKTCVHLFKTDYHSRNVKLLNNTSDTLVSTQNIVGWKQTLGSGKVSHLEVIIEGNENNINAYGIFADRAILNTHHPDITCKCNGGLNVVNKCYYSTNIVDTNGGNANKSEKINIIYTGYLRSYDGTTNYGLYTANNSTLFSVGATIEGTNFSFNDANNSVPNSFLKTVDSYAFTTEINNITNITALDNYGGSSITDGNLGLGDEVGAINSVGNKNISVGIQVGTLNTNGNRNVLMGVDTGNKMTSGDENVMVGVDAGNISLGDRNTLLGDASGSKLVNGNDNTFVGHHSGKDMVGGSRNVLLGGNIASSSTNMYDDIVIGYQSGTSMNNGNTNIIMGNNSSGALTIGSNNLILGHDTARSITTSNENVLVGNLVGKDATTTSTSVLMGYQTGTNFKEIIDNVIIGHQAGQGGSNAIGQKNVVIGARAGKSMTTSNENVIIGTSAASRLTTGGKNIIIGSESQNDIYSSPASNLTTGSDNIIMGNDTAIALTTGIKNLILGNASGKSLDGTNDTIILGYGSGSKISGSSDSDGKSIIIGNDSALNITSGRAIIIGHGSGTKSTGDDIMVIGNQAGRTVEGPRNTIIGNYAGGISNSNNYPIKGADNVLIGTYAGYSLNTGSHNVIIGSGDSSNGSSGYDITSGDGNMIMGFKAGRQLTTGDFNVLFGKNAGNKVNDGNRNVIIGNDAGKELGSGGSNNDDNLILGNEAGKSYTNAASLLLIGQRAGYSGTSGQDNTYIGNDSGYENVSGARNTLIGNKAGYKNIDSDNTMIGVSAGEYSTTAQQNTFIGQYAGRGKGAGIADNNTGDQNTYIGYETGVNTTSGYQNITMGFRAGKSLDTGAKNIMVGPNAGLNASTSSKNIFIGTAENDSLGVGMNTTGNFNTFIGVDTGLNNTSGAENISIGSHAGKENTQGDNNINIGDDAGQNITTGDNNINIGKQTGDSIVEGARNIVVGSEAGNNMGSNVNDNIVIGAQAGQNNTVDNSIFIGKGAGKLNTSGVGNILIGPLAGSSMSQNRDNIMIGSNAGSGFNRTSDTQGENIYIGPEAGSQNVTGIQNIIIGSEAFSRSTQGSGVIAIGYQAGNNAGVLTDNLGSGYDNTIIGFQAGSGGDMNINNVIIGSKAGKNVDNARKFRGNLLMGTEAGLNSSLGVNSVVVGSANKVGTGGDTNIMMGTSAGENVGNPNVPTIKPLTSTAIIHNSTNLSVVVDIPLSTALYYFKDGDDILIEDADNSNYLETSIGTILPDNTATPTDSRCKIVFTTPYANTIGSIDVGASIFSISKISNYIGENDTSKSSANTLLGTESGSSLTTGSKNIAMGSEAMNNNKNGKYNNVLGTQAGYYLKSDNNTCLGTRAGFSLDQYTNTNNTTSTDMTFTANTNTITSVGQDLSGYPFGTVFEVEGSSKNDDRYIVSSSSANTVIVEGLPKIEELGVPTSVDADTIKLNSSIYNYVDVNFNGNNVSAGAFLYETSDGLTSFNTDRFGIFATSGTNSNLNLLNDATIYKIDGSKYNDGVYYVDETLDRQVSSNNNTVVHSKFNLFPEEFNSNVNISSRSINSGTISSGIDYNDFTLGSSFYIFFGGNKGIYSVNSNDTKRLYSQRLNNNTFFINEEINNITGDSNVVFTDGLIQDISFDNLTDTKETYTITKQFNISDDIRFFSSNNNIVFLNNKTATSSFITGDDAYYYLTGTYSNGFPISNNNKIIKVSSLTGSNKILDISDTTPLVDEQINCSDLSNSVVLNYNHIRELNKDISSDFIPGTILNIDYSKLNNGLVDGGTYLVEDGIKGSTNFVMLSGNQVIPNLFFDSYLTNDMSAQTNNIRINKEIYSVDTDYLANKNEHIHGYQLFFQTGNITPESGTPFTMHNSNHHITTETRYQFTELVAPCMVKISSNYYLVKENKYPFKKLIVDSTFNSFGGDNTTSLIEFSSVSSRNVNNCNLSVMSSGIEYTIFGGNNNHINTITPILNAISDKSVYVTGNINNYKSTGKFFNLSTYVNTGSPGQQSKGFTTGYFKNIELNNRLISSITINASNTAIAFSDGTMALSTAKRLVEKDILKITDNVDSSKTGLFDIANVNVSSNIITVNHDGINFPNFGSNINIKCNEFFFTYQEGDSEFNLDHVATLSGEHKKFLRLNRIQSDDDYVDSGSIKNRIITKSLNLSVDDVYFNGSVVNSNISSNSNAIYFKENVPDESYLHINSNSYTGRVTLYSMGLGTPVLESNGNEEKEKRNINTPPIGFIDNYIENVQSTTDTYNDDGLGLFNNFGNTFNNIKGRFNYFTANNTISLQNLTSNVYASTYQYYLNKKSSIGINHNVSEPFQYPLREDMFIYVYASNISGDLIKTDFKVSNIIDSTTIELDSSYNNLGSDVIFNFNGTIDMFLSISISSNITTNYQGQLYSDRYDFANFSNITSEVDINNSQIYYGLSKIDIANIDSDSTFKVYYDDSLIPDGGVHNLISGVSTDDNNPQNLLDYEINGINNYYKDMTDRGEHLWIIPSSNLSISSNGTNITFDASDNSINSTSTDLSIYNPGQKLIITNTTNNNGVFSIVENKIATSTKIFIQENITTESPRYVKIEKSILHDEISIFTDTDNTTNFVNSSNSVVTSNSNVDFFDFVPNQTVVVTDTTNNNTTYTIANIIPTQSSLVLAVSPTNETGSNPTISKQIKLIKLGEAVTTTTSEGVVKFHYTDAQGNNMMLGSFTGQYAGANGLSIHNTYIGNKVGQTNQGSGNILMGNETGFATNYTQGASTYNNKFAVYKNNFIGVPNKPLIGGDFATGTVGINTIDPDSIISGTLDSGTKLVVNGAIRASSHNTFTGTHIIILEDKIVSNVQPGMIIRSTGQVEKQGIIDTIVSCELTSNAKDKRVYGVYCHSDNVSYKKENKDTGKIETHKETLHYSASVGEGCILVSTVNGELENGDYISSSPISGYGQLQDDDFLHSYTVAKITEDIDWSTVNSTHSYEGNTYKFALVSCSYHCG